MLYPLKPKPRPRKGFRNACIVVVIFVAILFTLFSLGSSSLFGVFGTLGVPLWKTRDAITGFVSSRFAFLKTKDDLITENSHLQSQLNELPALTAERDALAAENQALKSVASVPSGEMARVLSSPGESPYDIVMVGLGNGSQVRAGDLVLGPDSVALGVVLERSGSLARVQYFSSAGKSIPARLARDGSELLLTGEGGGGFLFVAPRGLSITIGDIVTLPSYDLAVVGRVAAVETLRSDSFKNVYISYPLNIFDLQWVRIRHSSTS